MYVYVHMYLLSGYSLQNVCSFSNYISIVDGRTEISLESDNNLSSRSTNYEKVISTLKSSLPPANSSQVKSGLLEIKTNTEDNNNDSNKNKNDIDEDDTDDNVVTPAGWTAEDVASYWYSQVEITTHLGPLRRVWMGPQFTFHTYSKQVSSCYFSKIMLICSFNVKN